MSESKVKVVGIASYSVDVDCPDCGYQFNCAEQSSECEVTAAMFKNTTESCTNMDIELACPKCGKEFTLDKIEY